MSGFLLDNNTSIGDVGGRLPGTFFGDNLSVTTRVSSQSAKWSQGLPIFSAIYNFSGSSRWFIIDDPNSSELDGACRFETGTTPNSKLTVTTLAHNRYEPGRLSFFGYTAAFDIANANGDFVMLIGGLQTGAKSLALDDQIKEGIMWGYKRDSGVTSKILRVYKNFIHNDYPLQNGDKIDFSKLTIYEQLIGYYGIHPSIITAVITKLKKSEILDYHEFNQAVTSINDPNLALGVHIESNGNTGNIGIINGSLEFGNYSSRNTLVDSSARFLTDSVLIPTLAVDPDPTDGSGFVAAYRVTDYFQSYKEVNATGTVLDFFQSKIENQLVQISGYGDATQTVNLNIYFIPAEDIDAVFTSLSPYVNVLERALSAAVTSIDFTNARLVFSVNITGGGVGQAGFGANSAALDNIQPKLQPGTVAVLSLQSVAATTINDFRADLITKDLF